MLIHIVYEYSWKLLSILAAFLNDNGLEIDHAHQFEKDELEVTITHEEIAFH